MAARQFLAQLADGLEERQPLDVADRAADLDQHEVDAFAGIGEHEVADLVGDVRDHLHRRPEVVAAALLLDDGLVDLTGGDVIGLGGVHTGEALVVPQVEVGLRAVVGHEDLAVLIGAHRPRIDVQIGVKLAQADLIAASLQERAKGGGRETFSQGGDHAAGDENVPGHGRSDYLRFASGALRRFAKACGLRAKFCEERRAQTPNEPPKRLVSGAHDHNGA